MARVFSLNAQYIHQLFTVVSKLIYEFLKHIQSKVKRN